MANISDIGDEEFISHLNSLRTHELLCLHDDIIQNICESKNSMEGAHFRILEKFNSTYIILKNLSDDGAYYKKYGCGVKEKEMDKFEEQYTNTVDEDEHKCTENEYISKLTLNDFFANPLLEKWARRSALKHYHDSIQQLSNIPIELDKFGDSYSGCMIVLHFQSINRQILSAFEKMINDENTKGIVGAELSILQRSVKRLNLKFNTARLNLIVHLEKSFQNVDVYPKKEMIYASTNPDPIFSALEMLVPSCGEGIPPTDSDDERYKHLIGLYNRCAVYAILKSFPEVGPVRFRNHKDEIIEQVKDPLGITSFVKLMKPTAILHLSRLMILRDLVLLRGSKNSITAINDEAYSFCLQFYGYLLRIVLLDTSDFYSLRIKVQDILLSTSHGYYSLLWRTRNRKEMVFDSRVGLINARETKSSNGIDLSDTQSGVFRVIESCVGSFIYRRITLLVNARISHWQSEYYSDVPELIHSIRELCDEVSSYIDEVECTLVCCAVLKTFSFLYILSMVSKPLEMQIAGTTVSLCNSDRSSHARGVTTNQEFNNVSNGLKSKFRGDTVINHGINTIPRVKATHGVSSDSQNIEALIKFMMVVWDVRRDLFIGLSNHMERLISISCSCSTSISFNPESGHSSLFSNHIDPVADINTVSSEHMLPNPLTKIEYTLYLLNAYSLQIDSMSRNIKYEKGVLDNSDYIERIQKIVRTFHSTFNIESRISDIHDTHRSVKLISTHLTVEEGNKENDHASQMIQVFKAVDFPVSIEKGFRAILDVVIEILVDPIIETDDTGEINKDLSTSEVKISVINSMAESIGQLVTYMEREGPNNISLISKLLNFFVSRIMQKYQTISRSVLDDFLVEVRRTQHSDIVLTIECIIQDHLSRVH